MVHGLRIHMSPRSCRIPEQARGYADGFMYDTEEAALWASLPAGIDVLVTHTPPLGLLDQSLLGLIVGGSHVGSAALRRRVEEIRPQFHIFGHIHERSAHFA